ncbi:hypothetical protein RCH33_2452 [Flavobacterium daejeonense]|nr:hypothetical protein RCH33_2452 [Flavobacterium daejeonense]
MKKSILFILIILLGISCKNSQTESNQIDSNQTENEIPQIPIELSEFNIDQIKKIHQYMNVDRWNNNGNISMRMGTDYNKLAEKLNIPVSKLKEIDNYYNREVLKILDKKIKSQFKNHKNFEPDYYNSVESTAYCGINTLRGNIVVYGRKDTTDFKAEAEKIAKELIGEIPDWITGYKLNFTRYEDPNLETKGDIDIGFLWVKGQDIQIMKSSTGLYGYEKPESNTFWHTCEWNNQRKIPYPNL